MEYEVEDGALGSIPQYGAIFMSNASTKRECFGRKLFGLPSAMANFVKQVKSGMILFLFEFESRELYGVFRATSDGAMNIVPHAFSSSGKQFPAQVRFTPLWYCNPLSELEFRDAIQENYFSWKKFNFGLSDDQVSRLLRLFSSRKLEKPQRQFSRQSSKAIWKDRRVAGHDRSFLRNRAEEFVDDEGLAQAINTKHHENSSSNIESLDDDRFLKSDGIENELSVDNYHGYDMAERPGVSLGKRRRRRDDDDGRFSVQDRIQYGQDVDHGLGEFICIDHQGDTLGKLERVAEDSWFLLSDTVETERIIDHDIGPIVTPEYPGDCGAKVRRATYGRFPGRDNVVDRHTTDNDFGLVASSDYLENPAIEARRATDDCHFLMGNRVESDGNFGNYPEPVISADHHRSNPLGKIRTRDDGKLSVSNRRMEIERHVESGIRTVLSSDYLEKPQHEVKEETVNCKFSVSGRTEIPTDHLTNRFDYVRRANDIDRFLASISMENEHNVDNDLGPVISNKHSGHPLDEIRRVADAGKFLGMDRVDAAYNMENSFGPSMSTGLTNLRQSMQNPSSYSSKPMLETDYSLHREEPKPRSSLPRSKEQKVFEFSYPTSHDAMVKRSVPYDPEVPNLHYGRSPSVGVDCASHLVQDFPLHHSFVGNLFTSSSKQSSPYPLEDEELRRQHLDDAYGFVNKVPVETNHNHYSQTSSSLLSAEYYGKMKAQATGDEVYEDLLFSGTASAIPYTRNETYEGQNIDPSIDFDEHTLASQGGYKHKNQQHDTNQAFYIENVPFKNNTSYLHSASSCEKSDSRDAKYYQKSKGTCSDSKRERRSVFDRLTRAPEVNVQEKDSYLGYDECDVDASVDQVMDTLHQSLKHGIMKAKKFPLVGRHHLESDTLKMMRMKVKDDAELVIEENCDQLIKETRVVSFKRRSETKRNKEGNKTNSSVETVGHEKEGSVQKPEHEGLEGKHKCRKLLRPVFGKING
ncbi:uncharacterized protein LOC130793515 isoform X2 [Actinidia eriantha]|nr:uncharacterized protein LOC130793515 isoform X2 [Actinidia eriantha]XP_057511217.1 uncharacterized protein LOC130793515 isoform X2 [Actinidia eriantha]